MPNFVDRSSSTFAQERKDFITAVDDLAYERVGVWIPIRSVDEGIAVKRAKANIPRKKLFALRTTPRFLAFLFVGSETSGVDFCAVAISGWMRVWLYAYWSRHLVESI
jgi:hypothetical protein